MNAILKKLAGSGPRCGTILRPLHREHGGNCREGGKPQLHFGYWYML